MSLPQAVHIHTTEPMSLVYTSGSSVYQEESKIYTGKLLAGIDVQCTMVVAADCYVKIFFNVVDGNGNLLFNQARVLSTNIIGIIEPKYLEKTFTIIPQGCALLGGGLVTITVGRQAIGWTSEAGQLNIKLFPVITS